MLDISADSHTSEASSLTTEELIRNLGRFPSPVLPVGVMRELQSRGDVCHDELADVLRQAIDSVHDSKFNPSRRVFFCFALLIRVATYADRSLIEPLLTMDAPSAEAVIGDLLYEGGPYLIADFFRGQSPGLAPSDATTISAAEILDWIDRVLDQRPMDSWSHHTLLRAITLAVSFGYLDRATAIDAFVRRLEKRADVRYDDDSATIVSELIDMGARDSEAVDAIVRACFKRNQIDEDFVDLKSWDSAGPSSELKAYERKWIDPGAELTKWCYEFVSDDLDPLSATYRFSEHANRSLLGEPIVPNAIDELRQSSDSRYPKEAINVIDGSFAYFYDAIVDLISQELARYQSDSESWSGNGAYLGLVLTISNQMPLPTNLLATILQLSLDDREQLFGDQSLLIVHAAALAPQTSLDFVEQWIWDPDRSDADRRDMVDFYVLACDFGFLDREAAISLLAAGLRRALVEQDELVAPYAENLALLTPTEHSELLDKAFERDDVDWFVPLSDLRRMARDAKFASEQFYEQNRQYRIALEMITNGLMFDRELLQPPSARSRALANPVIPTPPAKPQTIRNDPHTGRNDPCPCGSGKKYKKCCLK